MILIPPQVNHFEFFGIQIHFYSICIFFAIFISLLVALKLSECSKMNTDKNVILDFAPMLIVFSILGARIYYILLALNYYIKEPLRAFAVWEGGLSIHGAFIGGVLFGIWYFKKRKLNFFSYADIFAAVLPLGQAIGRWGNFFNSEAFGVPVSKSAPFILYVSEIFRPNEYMNFEFFS
ncbi:MAG: prolipoprotein diacylglyceryl transferase, partial [Candidatus Gastranaerophilales bacterium]|nr:prolipoprotein diacylglyceryl transferase [Candidatus Gastranaerophilales bacterium]